jgi:2-polyprenyl-3-methyl-5-hydroxy-6-metoxy-1,4-benzoquinol methylase/ADP-heptose:LPS heptosyltransferase
MRVLLRQQHGLGDAVQLTIILKHLRHYHPDWQIDVELSRGKHSVAQGLCHQVWTHRDNPAKDNYDKIFHLNWPEANACYEDFPSDKVTRCLYDVFRLAPLPELYVYEIKKDHEAVRLANEYLATVPKRLGYVFIHYEGNSSVKKKNLSQEDISFICNFLLENGFTPIILDWDKRTTLVDQRTIFCPDLTLPLWKNNTTGDATVLAALIDKGRLFVGIDSGPLHVAGATSTPAIGIWTWHHPVNFFDLSPNVMHMIPQDARRNIKGRDKDKAQRYFEKAYRFKYYRNLRFSVMTQMAEMLGCPPPDLNPMKNAHRLRSRAYDEDYYWEHKNLGLDYAEYGEWQCLYGHWIAAALNWRGQKILDVGCACGALTKALTENGCSATGCDLNEYCIQLGREKWPSLPLVICDALNLHLFADQTFDGVHLMQTLEHIRPEHVPFVLTELNRVCKPASLLFSVHDTTELFGRQNRDGHREDPTHVCIRPRHWWTRILEASGWEDCGQDYRNKLLLHPLSYLPKYDWDWFVFRKTRHFDYK